MILSSRILQRWVDSIDWAARVEPMQFGPQDTIHVFKTSGVSDTCCTGYAIELQRMFGQRVVCYGFYNTQNPGSAIAKDFGGHDFALLDGRFIIDPWLTQVEQHWRSVFDLEDPEDSSTISRLYGDRGRWSPLLESLLQSPPDRPAISTP